MLHISTSLVTCVIAGAKCIHLCTTANLKPLFRWRRECETRDDAFSVQVVTVPLGSGRKAPPHISVSSSARINEAADFKDHKIQVASCLISLKVEPSPALSHSLLGGPLIKIVLTHMLVRLAPGILGKLKCSSRSQSWLLGVGRLPYQRDEGHSLAATMVTQTRH